MYSTLEQSRVDTESLVNQLIANHDLTPASDGKQMYWSTII